MTEAIKVSESLELHAVAKSHATPPYQLIRESRTWSQQSLSWPRLVQSEEDTRKTVQDDMMLYQHGCAKIFMTFKEDEPIGVVSFNHIELLNKTAEIGHWLDESHQGQGTVSRALQALIHRYAQLGELRHFVIKYRVDNPQSSQVTLRNGFILEGCLKQAESLNDAYDDVNLYARIIDP